MTNNAVRGVAVLLAAVALLGFYLGVRGAMPTARDADERAPAATTASGPVQDAQPIQEVIPPPPVPEPKAADANLAASKADEEEADEEEAAPAPPPPPPVKAARPPAVNSAPADPIGNLIQAPPPEENPSEPVPF
ncbi:MAG: hypothetical protein IT546_15215 [Caulobacteraceae bacterium]|nr:hypothetical protein [Caulobacteraceae bacterium]